MNKNSSQRNNLYILYVQFEVDSFEVVEALETCSQIKGVWGLKERAHGGRMSCRKLQDSTGSTMKAFGVAMSPQYMWLAVHLILIPTGSLSSIDTTTFLFSDPTHIRSKLVASFLSLKSGPACAR